MILIIWSSKIIGVCVDESASSLITAFEPDTTYYCVVCVYVVMQFLQRNLGWTNSSYFWTRAGGWLLVSEVFSFCCPN